MTLLRDILRRKLRSVLTITGVAVGVFALVVLGAVVERSTVQIDVLKQQTGEGVTVTDAQAQGFAGMSDGSRPLTAEKKAEIEAVVGVHHTTPLVVVLIDDTSAITWVPSMVLGGGWADPSQVPPLQEGRMHSESETGVTTLGHDLAAQLGVGVGETVELRGERFEVVGVLERTLISVYDQAAMVPVGDARELYIASLPEAFRTRIEPEDVIHQLSATPEEGITGDELAERIENEVDGIVATSSHEALVQVEQMMAAFDLVIVSVGVVALLVGGLSIVNTMLVAVGERTHEIGVSRALGASSRRIARDVLAESALLGSLGGMLGLGAGAFVATTINSMMVAQAGVGLFLVSWRLVIATAIFVVILGIFGGLYPAWYAARMDPVEALARR